MTETVYPREMVTIRMVTPDDLNAVAALETACFPPMEAASRESFAYRIAAFPESFYVAEACGRIIGAVNGCVTNDSVISDRLYKPEGGHDPHGKNQTVFGLLVAPERRRQGIAAELMHHFMTIARAAGRENMLLTCKEPLIHYYETFGYVNQGISASTHGGAVWYDMAAKL